MRCRLNQHLFLASWLTHANRGSASAHPSLLRVRPGLETQQSAGPGRFLFMSISIDAFLEETAAYRQYVLVLSDGSTISMTIAVGEDEADTAAEPFARDRNAVASGLITIADAPDAPEFPVIWVVTETRLILKKAVGDPTMSSELEELIGRYLGLFFVQIAPFAPQLAGIEVKPTA